MRNFVEKVKAIETVVSKVTLLVFAFATILLLYISVNH